MSDDDETHVRVGIVSVSDRASRGEYEDRGGPAIREYLDEVLATEWTAEVAIVPDEQAQLEATLRRLAATCCLILTTGGTGITVRDVTPEATLAVADKVVPGFGEAMRAASLAKVPTAILARQVAVTVGRCLVINLPGSPKAIRECLDAVFPAVPHAIQQLGGPKVATRGDRLPTRAEFH